MKKFKYYILLLMLVVYHLLFRDWWTPALYYTGTYITILFLFYDKFKQDKDCGWIWLIAYFGLVYVALMLCINENIKQFYDNLSLRKYALGFAGLGILIIMTFRHEDT